MRQIQPRIPRAKWVLARKRAQRADTATPPESQPQYEALVASLDGIVWEADAATFQFSFVSQQAERLLGYPVAQWLAEPNFWKDHLHPEDREWAVALCVAATQQQSAHDLEYRMLAADGRAVWLRDLVSVVVENDRATTLRGIMVDISRRKETEAALRESQERLHLAVDSSNTGLWDFDIRTRRSHYSNSISIRRQHKLPPTRSNCGSATRTARTAGCSAAPRCCSTPRANPIACLGRTSTSPRASTRSRRCARVKSVSAR
jgi:PAS domain S-box-containing protein